MGSFFSSNAHTEAPPEETPGAESGQPLPSTATGAEVRPQKRYRVEEDTIISPKKVKPSHLDLSKYKLKELAFGSQGEEATKLPKQVEDVSQEGAPVDLARTYVWYASYGSNLLEERFMCYVKGGKTESMAMSLAPCSDPTPPTAIDAFVVPHRLFFAHEKSVTWGAGGVSFITSKETPDSKTIIRAYRVTLQQFNEVARKENSASAPVGSVCVSPENLVQLRARDEKSLKHNALDCVIQKGKYRTVKYLGDYQGEPVLTFTASHQEQEEIASGHVPLVSPSDKYRACIVQGLVEVGLSREDAETYVEVRASTPLSETTG
ncbi:histone deacetylase complex catalytic component HDA1 [Klebsormidium nitens]|uniref:Histone deacetylase complex catalytic component HDA1 n=1 Tax=Klebsormidium nitens TaxID=105231 RepID=A0A1Y1I033_KLENI|nr:histone deacetylase complex catalytic component HDA1 [Klebsormidium nitens]|eukprot:GAQ82531.1 histone deacetylase complex catalytic component HDA1 [Klebsormidium nitens]